MSLLMAGELELDDPFQPLPFYDSMILWFYDSDSIRAMTRPFGKQVHSDLKLIRPSFASWQGWSGMSQTSYQQLLLSCKFSPFERNTALKCWTLNRFYWSLYSKLQLWIQHNIFLHIQNNLVIISRITVASFARVTVYIFYREIKKQWCPSVIYMVFSVFIAKSICHMVA